MNVGFVGLGQMGRPMAERLQGAGYRVKAWNRTRISVAMHDTPQAVLDSDVVVTMLADDTAVRAVWLDSGLAQRLPRGAIHLNMATVSMRIARELLQYMESLTSRRRCSAARRSPRKGNSISSRPARKRA